MAEKKVKATVKKAVAKKAVAKAAVKKAAITPHKQLTKYDFGKTKIPVIIIKPSTTNVPIDCLI